MRAIPFILLLAVGCTHVDPGHVGIRENFYGENRGVDPTPIRAGKVPHNPLTSTIHEYPTYTRSVVWTADRNEGSRNDDSFTFNTVEGEPMNVDIALQYRIGFDDAPKLFAKLRKTPDEIEAKYLRTKLRNALSFAGSTRKAIGIMGREKNSFLAATREKLAADLAPYIIVEGVSIVGGMRPSGRVRDAISAATQAAQKAIEARNKVATSKAEADQKIEAARGDAESTLTRAKAEAEANRLRAESLSPSLIQYEALKRWDGVLPRMTGSQAIPFVEVK